jgi:dihydrolipoamide dehydrogenase
VDQKYILDSTGLLGLKELPKSLTVVGGGYIGIELGMVFAKLGTEVTIVEAAPDILPGFDPDVVKLLGRKLKQLKVKVLTDAKAKEHQINDEQTVLHIMQGEKETSITSDKIFVSIGRVPYSKGLNLEVLGINTDERGFLPVNKKLQTEKSNIYAIGDLVGQPMLAHKASKEGEIAAEVIAGKASEIDWVQMPAVVFCDPEVAHTGLTEKQAVEQGHEVNVTSFPYGAIGRAMTTNETDGFAKIISNKETGHLLGVTIVGANASDLISEASLAVENAIMVEDLALTVHPHPTFGEILMEAAKQNLGEAIHVLNK